MDPNIPIVLPADWAALYHVLANPVTFGILISMLLATLPFMGPSSTDSKGNLVPASLKMITVIAVCLAWAILVTLLNPLGFTPSLQAAYSILMLTFSVTLSTQIWHQVVSPLVAQIIEILFGVAVNLRVRAARISGDTVQPLHSPKPLLIVKTKAAVSSPAQHIRYELNETPYTPSRSVGREELDAANKADIPPIAQREG